MARAINIRPSELRPYILRADRSLPKDKQDEQTEFLLGALTTAQRATLQDDVQIDGATGAISGTGTRNLRTVKLGLRGVSATKPLRDENGMPVPFTTDRNGQVTGAFLERLSMGDINELASEIRGDLIEAGTVEKSEPSRDSQPEESGD